jgi:hypothetical protein
VCCHSHRRAFFLFWWFSDLALSGGQAHPIANYWSKHWQGIAVEPNERNGLRAACRLMVDKITTVLRTKVGARVGRLDDEDIVRLNQAVLVFLGLAVSPRTQAGRVTSNGVERGRGQNGTFRLLPVRDLGQLHLGFFFGVLLWRSSDVAERESAILCTAGVRDCPALFSKRPIFSALLGIFVFPCPPSFATIRPGC